MIVGFERYWNVLERSKINDKKTWIKSNDKKFLIHDLKKNSVFSNNREIKAIGLNNTNIWIRIYLNEYVKIKLIMPIDEKDLIMPSNENRLYIESFL